MIIWLCLKMGYARKSVKLLITQWICYVGKSLKCGFQKNTCEHGYCKNWTNGKKDGNNV